MFYENDFIRKFNPCAIHRMTRFAENINKSNQYICNTIFYMRISSYVLRLHFRNAFLRKNDDHSHIFIESHLDIDSHIIHIKYHYNRVTHSSILRRNRIFYGNYCIKRAVLRTQYYRIESATDWSPRLRPHNFAHIHEKNIQNNGENLGQINT